MQSACLRFRHTHRNRCKWRDATWLQKISWADIGIGTLYIILSLCVKLYSFPDCFQSLILEALFKPDSVALNLTRRRLRLVLKSFTSPTKLQLALQADFSDLYPNYPVCSIYAMLFRDLEPLNLGFSPDDQAEVLDCYEL